MAGLRGGFRRFRRGIGVRRPRRWTAQLTDRVSVVQGTLTAINLVTPADYRQAANLEPSGVTLVRIRGHFSYIFDVIAAGSINSIWAMISVSDANVGVTTGGLDPAVVGDLIDEKVLWWWSNSQHTNDQDLQLSRSGGEIDIRSRRRLQDESVVLSIRVVGTAGDTAIWTSGLRSLILGG